MIIDQEELFLLMSVFSQAFFALMGCHFMSFSLLPAWHDLKLLRINQKIISVL
jgi:hypothetical protein